MTNCVPRNAWRDVIRQPGFALDPQELWHVRDMYARPHLPQGAPTSPSLANFCSYRLDRRLSGIAQSGGAAYTRMRTTSLSPATTASTVLWNALARLSR